MTKSKRRIGYRAEIFAWLWMILRGYKPLFRNYTVKGGEIDLIMKKGDYLVFTEVKARKKNSQVSPLEAVTNQKQKRIKHAATCFISSGKADVGELQPRFDVICIQIGIFGFKVTDYIENAF